MKLMKHVACVVAMTALPSFAVQADTLANLERERSLFLIKQLEPVSVNEGGYDHVRQEGRLLDLERAVANDRSLENKFSAHARRALAEYDLTFLVHASVEKQKPALAHWLDTMGLDSVSIFNARVGRY